MNKKLDYAVRFAQFCLQANVSPSDLSELVGLTSKHIKLNTRQCNGENVGAQEQRARTRVKNKAKEMGFDVEWYGLTPTLLKDGRNVYFPIS